MRLLLGLVFGLCVFAFAGCGDDDPAPPTVESDTGGTTGDAGGTTGGTTGGTQDGGATTGDPDGGATGGPSDDGTTGGTEETELPPDVPDDGPADVPDDGPVDVFDDGSEIVPDGGATDDGPGTPEVDEETEDPDEGGGGEDIDTTTDDTGGGDTCEKQMDCAGEENFFVCNTVTKDVYQNTCFAFCGTGSYEDLSPVDSDECKDPTCLPPPGVTCQEKDKLGSPVCYKPADAAEQEYSNPYEACCAGLDWLTNPSVIPGQCTGEQECDQGCPPDVAQVCSSQENTYLNACVFDQCKLEGETISCGAPCGDAAGCPQCGPQGCAPVCGIDGKTYENACFAGCKGVTIEHAGACCDCEPPSSATLYCSLEGNTHGNLCELLCKQETPAYSGPCIDGCEPTLDDPEDGVCGNLDGEFTKFPNDSCAGLAGATCVYEGNCAFGTNSCVETNTEYTPVCAKYPDPETGVTTQATFQNACHAGCAAAFEVVDGLCPVCSTICDTADPTPHCATSDCVLYPNKCVPNKCLSIDDAFLTKNSCPASCED